MTYPYSKDEFNEMTGGFHPASLCGEDCSGCCDDDECANNVPVSNLDRVAVAQLLERFNPEEGVS
jgi:hypothetical protein